MGHRRVAIGGTFACDEALAVPLQYLLANAVWNVSADIQWLAYGSLVDFGEWSAEVLHVAHPPDLVVFLVRLSDLEAAHPELSVSTTSADSPAERNAGVANDPIEQFLCDLGKYNATNGSVAPLVVLLCPCAPSEDSNFELGERKFQRKIDAMQNVHMRSSGQLMDLFQQQHTCEFYDAVGDKRQHSPYTQEMFNVLSLSVCRQVCRLFRTAGSQKKVIVLDCDNTLWGGAVAEVGAQDISLTPNFLALQRFVVAQQRRGMLLALCSKNIHQDVAQAFEQRSDMVLDLHKHVVATKINWRLKSENIAELAKELSLGKYAAGVGP
ncbi:hypothetical protein PHYBOEH_005808 [Phytophthora boehmeriae]|uniref:FCP1 homology domain-containing protein n=1 Tax=Phytophthora boehmeriae TaxID=109152 RepID=A0A8T1X8P7_9STRA|nr:hypothetical protein PHYBOEH_005808 [Phytophthora boehmeriae]